MGGGGFLRGWYPSDAQGTPLGKTRDKVSEIQDANRKSQDLVTKTQDSLKMIQDSSKGIVDSVGKT